MFCVQHQVKQVRNNTRLRNHDFLGELYQFVTFDKLNSPSAFSVQFTF